MKKCPSRESNPELLTEIVNDNWPTELIHSDNLLVKTLGLPCCQFNRTRNRQECFSFSLKIFNLIMIAIILTHQYECAKIIIITIIILYPRRRLLSINKIINFCLIGMNIQNDSVPVTQTLRGDRAHYNKYFLYWITIYLFSYKYRVSHSQSNPT